MLEACYWVFICITITLFRRPLMGLFVTAGNEGIVALGSSYLGLMALFYVFPAFTNGIQGFFRGMGDLKVTLYSTFMNMLGRVVAVFVMLRLLHMDFASLAWANMIGWIVMLLFEIPLLVKSLRSGECR